MICWLALYSLTKFTVVNQFIEKKLSAVIKSSTGFDVKFTNFSLALPFAISADKVVVSKDEEQIISVDKYFKISPHPALLWGKIAFVNVTIKDATLYKLPKENSAQTETATPSLKLNYILLEDFKLAPGVFADLDFLSRITSSLEGSFKYNSHKKFIQAHLKASLVDMRGEFSPVNLFIDTYEDQIFLRAESFKNRFLNQSYPISAKLELKTQQNNPLQLVLGSINMELPTEKTSLQADFKLVDLSELKFNHAIITGPNIDLVASAAINRQKIIYGKIDGYVNVENFYKINCSANFSGPYDDIEIQSNLSIDDKVSYQNLNIESVAANLTIALKDNIQADIKLDGTVNKQRLDLSSNFKADLGFEQLEFTNLTLSDHQSRITGQLLLSPENFYLKGNLSGESLDLSPFIELPVKTDLSINFASKDKVQQIELNLENLTLSQPKVSLKSLQLDSEIDLEDQTATVDLTAHKLTTADINIENVNGKILVSEIFTKLSTKAQINISEISAQDLSIGRVSIEGLMESWLNDSAFELEVSGDNQQNLQLDISGSYRPNDDELNILVDGVRGFIGEAEINSKGSFEVIKLANNFKVTPVSLNFGAANFYFNYQKIDDQVTADFSAANLDSNFWQYIPYELPFTGSINLNSKLRGSTSSPEGILELQFTNIKLTENYLNNTPQLSGKLLMKQSNGAIKLLSKLDGIDSSPLIIEGTMPYSFNLQSLAPVKKEAQEIDLNISGSGEISSFLPLFLDNPPSVFGNVQLDLSLKGSLAEPKIGGSLTLSDGMYEDLDSETTFEHINANLSGDGNYLILNKLTAQDLHGGSINITGKLEINKEQAFPFTFDIDTSRIYLLHSDYATISASGPLKLEGNLNESKVTGNLTAEKSIFKLEEALPKQIKTIDIEYINVPENFKIPTETSSKSPLSFDIHLEAPQLVVQGNGLKSSWKGAINIQGNSAQPLLYGDINIQKGSYEIKGKTFELSQGTIHFAGAVDKKTSLYVVATKELDDLKVEIIVKGLLNKLSFSFRSNPPMSQREILSYILFNKGISEITTGQSDSLDQSFISINSTEQTDEKSDLLSKLRNNMGIDRLDLTSAGDGENQDFALQVGKYLWEGVLISLNKSIGTAPDKVAIEMKLKKEVKAEAEVDIGGNNSQGKISLKWKKDY